MKFAVYLDCLPKKAQGDRKYEILSRYASGVKALGDELILHSGNSLVPADVAMIVGFVHENSKNTPHLMLRKNVLDYQANNKKRTLMADSNLFLYSNTDNPHYYLRYSFDGVFPNTGTYFDDAPDPDRWKKISSEMNISLKDYRKDGSHILLCLQRNGGWSMGKYDVIDWTAETIKTLKKYTNRPIIIRPHPGDREAGRYLNPVSLMKKIGNLKDVRVSREPNFLRDLKHCWAVVNYNSSPAVGAAIEGFPVFVTDPERSQAGEIANTDLSKIENPTLPDRQQWIERLAMFHWSFKEIESGEAWSHMRKYV